MKKIILGLLFGAVATISFAKPVVVSDNFDSTKMMCGERHVDDGINKKDLKDMHCKKYSEKKENIYFFDDNSKKLVHCKADKVGDIAIAECKAS